MSHLIWDAHLKPERDDTINSFMSWVGGKKALRDQILSRVPVD